jgi:hypothetical protein
MALSEDSRSLLQLLLARGKSYQDIAGLLDVETTEVRLRAASALAELGGDGPRVTPALTDYLLGQADPIDRAECARALAEDPELLGTAQELSDQLRLLVPGAELPKLAATAGSLAGAAGRRPAKAPTVPEAATPRFPASLTAGQRRLLAVLVGGALLVGLVVVLIGALGNDDGDQVQAQQQPAPTTAILRPVAGESGQGKVEFGFSGTSLAANLQFSDLKPSTDGNSYTLWLFGPGGSFPLNQTRVTDSGAITGQIQINEAIICFIAGDLFPDMRLSRVTDAEMSQTLREARNGGGGGAQGGLPDFVGDLVLEGTISMPQDAKDQILQSCNGPQ